MALLPDGTEHLATWPQAKLRPAAFVPFVILDRNKRKELTQMDYLGGEPKA